MIVNLIFCLLTLVQLGNEKPVPHILLNDELKDSANVFHDMLFGTVYFLEEKSPMTFEEVYEKFSSGDFIKIPRHAKFNKGYIGADYWFGVTVENMSDSPKIMDLGVYNSSIYQVNFFEFNEEGRLLETDSAGYAIPGNKRKLNHRNDVFELYFPAKSKRTILSKINFNGGKSGTTFFLGDYQKNNRDSGWRAFLIGIISGRLYTVVVLAFLVFLFFNQRVYIFLSAYVFFGIVILLESDRQFLDFIELKNYIRMGPWLTPISVLLLTVFALLFTQELFSINGKKSLTAIWVRLFTVLQLTYAGICLLLFFYYLQPKEMPIFYTVCHYLGVVNMVLLLVVCLLQIRRTPGLTAFALSANLLLAIGATVYLITRLGYTQILPLDLGFLIYGLTFNLLIIIIGLVYQFFSSQKERLRLVMEQNQIEQQMVRLTIEAQDKERQRIAKDLHDDLGSNLAMIKLRTEMLLENQNNGNSNSLQEIHSMLDGACKDLRYISHELMPADLSTKVMRTMIEELVEKLSVQRKVSIHAHVDDIPILSIDTKVNLFRIIKELMNNILKHAQATEATIRLSQTPDLSRITLEISDNGKGIPKEVLEENSKGMGLKNLEKRVEYLKGELSIKSNRLGTRIVVTVPLETIPSEVYSQSKTEA